MVYKDCDEDFLDPPFLRSALVRMMYFLQCDIISQFFRF